MNPKKKKSIALKLIVISIVLGLIGNILFLPSANAWNSFPLTKTDSEVSDALAYLAGQQNADGSIGDFAQSAWVVMAVAAAGDDPNSWSNGSNSIVDYLSANATNATNVTDYSRMVMAIMAANQNPSSFGGIDFLGLLEGEYDGTQIGNALALNDDSWAILALISTGMNTNDAIITNSANFIETHQNTDGGWSWNIGGLSDPDSTAACMMSLIAAGESKGSTVIQQGLTYLKNQQADNGGFNSWGSTNADADAWAINALSAAGEDPTSSKWQSGSGNSPIDHLVSLQAPDGSYEWEPGNAGATPNKTTSCAIVALLGKSYPIVVSSTPEGETIDVRIEGNSQTIWAGRVTVNDTTVIDDTDVPHYLPNPTALGALHEASLSGGFTYEVRDFGAMGLVITKINGVGNWDKGPWWMFFVDGEQPSVGASTFELNVTSPPSPLHHEVLITYSGSFTEQATSLSIDKSEVDVGETVTATVTYFDGSTWQPLEGATLHADIDYITNAYGMVSISVDHDTTLRIFAEKTGYVRSNKVTVIVGDGGDLPSSNCQVNVSATIIPAISIEVSPNSIDLGTDLGPRDTSDPVSVYITNNGAWDVRVTAQVQDTANDLFVKGLHISGMMWNVFSQTILRSESYIAQITLVVPEAYAGTGVKNGSIIFWAEEAL